MGAFDAQGGVVWRTRAAGSVATKKAYWFGDFLDLKMVDSERGTIMKIIWRAKAILEGLQHFVAEDRLLFAGLRSIIKCKFNSKDTEHVLFLGPRANSLHETPGCFFGERMAFPGPDHWSFDYYLDFDSIQGFIVHQAVFFFPSENRCYSLLFSILTCDKADWLSPYLDNLTSMTLVPHGVEQEAFRGTSALGATTVLLACIEDHMRRIGIGG